ncbi:uncharacterized protein At4g14450, chloroplastic-like [Rhodamnia argentea]|uniref:Uncharacterized protein At4g14450, chloroplastic-like n=1 Tax=Rhodamnia argentea TaxID=178133 RepID=A0A8B8MSE0_9MYRT|nr:uncharacterized protein At4g14450, chloroplastic-like [Rhodamnia argentea]
MADKTRSVAGGRRQSSRLQRRAPASLQIASPASQQWNVAIPLLSPLAASPTSPPTRLADRSSAPAKPREDPRAAADPEKKPVLAFKKWQHPAAPFCYEPGPLKPSFVPV